MSIDPPTDPRIERPEDTTEAWPTAESEQAPADEAEAGTGQPSPRDKVPPPAGQFYSQPEGQAQDALSGTRIETQPLPVVASGGRQRAQGGAPKGDLSTGPLATDNLASAADTVKLDESASPYLPPLEGRALIGERYKLVSLVGSKPGTNIYRVTDSEGYRQCWACGSTASQEGDTYCVECGAQLAGRYYRLQEFRMEADGLPAIMPTPILDNNVPGVARVYDSFEDTDLQRAYVVWDDVYGRPLSYWLPGEDTGDQYIAMSPPGTSGLLNIEEPDEEQALGWIAQCADILAELHSQSITGCDLSLGNFVVQAGDRLVLLDPLGSRQVDADTVAREQTLEVSYLAGELQRWYVGVMSPDNNKESAGTTPAGATPPADVLTGPLNRPSSPLQVLPRAREGLYATAEELAQALYELYEASKPPTGVQLWSGRASDVGRVRQINEDSVLALEANALEHEGSLSVGLYVVADGMGGHQSGEVASSIAARTIGAVINTSLIAPLVAGDPVARDPNTCATVLQGAVIEANRRICDLARERHSDLGTTVTAAIVLGTQLIVANVGDSRTYLWRDGQIAVVTRDHSLVAQLVALGQISPNDIYTHPRRNEIYRALGDPHLTQSEVDTFIHALQPGDAVLLCSDGLWDFVRDPAINEAITGADADPQLVCDKLVERANQAGGEDNISTIFVRLVDTKRNT